MKIKFFPILLVLLLNLPATTIAQELPKANVENSFYILPLYGIAFPTNLTFEETEIQYAKMKQELGEGNLYHRLGFSFIYTPSLNDLTYQDHFVLAEKYGVHLGLIFALQSHTRVEYRQIADTDLRQYQWRKDGEDWEGSLTNSGTLEIAEGQRNYKIPTPSRLANNLRSYNLNLAKEWALGALNLMEKYPDVVTCINGPIEEELAIGGINEIKMADYSPFAVTEFRDWLRHSNIYDATTGQYAGEGAMDLIIGDLIDFNGTLRSQFYDDPTPENDNGTGVSFNKFFGTNYQTWSLKYWDLDIFTDPITDENFDVSPESGLGFTENGFDAPRNLNPGSKFWNAWSYDIPDHGGQYPAGNPNAPAFGFRQNMVRNFVRDLFDVLITEGIPKNLLYAHQIPGEALDNFTGEAPRNRSSASTVWTGYLDKNETVGITRFGGIDPLIMTQYADDWGIFEWHTKPFAPANSQELYDVSLQDLNSYYDNNCHFLFPGWWTNYPPPSDAIFPLNDSKFSEAIGDFMGSRVENPYHIQGNIINYTPPVVNGVKGNVKDGILNAQWDHAIWNGLLAKWKDWGQFDYFEVQWSEDGTNWSNSQTTQDPFLEVSVIETVYSIRVRVNTTMGLVGPWSENIQPSVITGPFSIQLEPEFETLFFDPLTINPVKVTLSNPNRVFSPDLIQMNITGDGISLNTEPIGVENIEMFWPMDQSSEVQSFFGMDNAKFSGGVFSSTVTSLEPIDPHFNLNDSALNGAELPYLGFRMFSNVETTGELFWFTDAGHKSILFSLKAGWHVYLVANLPEWISQTQINSVRLDTGGVPASKILVDWVAISSQPISDILTDAFHLNNQEVTILTSPYGQPGSYNVNVDYEGESGSVTIQTTTANVKPEVQLTLPSNDIIVELGNSQTLSAVATDGDGYIDNVRFLVNGSSYITELPSAPYSFDWIPTNSGIYNIQAAAFDNNNESTLSNTISIDVREQTSFISQPHEIPGKIEAEDYDWGGASIAYLDSDLTNQGGEYRTDPVDIGSIPNQTDQYFLGWTKQDEWIEYTINVTESMKMQFNLNVASNTGGAEFYFEINNKRVTNNLIINSTEGDQIYTEYKIEDIFLKQGVQKLKLVIVKGNFNIDYIEILEYNGEEEEEEEEIIVDGIVLYPNPASVELFFSATNKEMNKIEIWSINGLLSRAYNFSPKEQGSVNIANLTTGIYIVKIFSNDQFWVKKVVIF